MTTTDLLVHGGTLVTSSATFRADVSVTGGTIAAIAAPGELGNDARRAVDATGRYVLPGIIDGHVHFREPGLGYKGALEVGSDADMTVVDLDLEDAIAEDQLHSKNNVTPFNGVRTRGAAVATIVRGQVVMQDGKLVGAPRGRMVVRCSA